MISEYHLYVERLNLNTSKDTVVEHFSRFGEVAKVALLIKHKSSQNKAFALVAFKEATSGKKALEDLNQEVGQAAKVFGQSIVLLNTITRYVYFNLLQKQTRVMHDAFFAGHWCTIRWGHN